MKNGWTQVTAGAVAIVAIIKTGTVAVIAIACVIVTLGLLQMLKEVI